jgi:hypothetical protein
MGSLLFKKNLHGFSSLLSSMRLEILGITKEFGFKKLKKNRKL